MYVGIAALVASGVAWWRVGVWRSGAEVASLSAKVEAMTQDNRVLTRDLETANKGLEEWRAAAMGCSDSTATLAAAGDELEERVRALERSLVREREAWQRRENELMQPLPPGCEDAVREAARRAKGG